MSDQCSKQSSKEKHRQFIGGEGSNLPLLLESFLSWLLCLSCLLVSGYYYVKIRYRMYRSKYVKYFLPLTTCSANEIERLNPLERLKQLELYLLNLGYRKEVNDEYCLIKLIRNNEISRRLATLSMCYCNVVRKSREINELEKENNEVFNNDFASILGKVWPCLLELPFSNNVSDEKIDISIIIPSYYEKFQTLERNLKYMFEYCSNPKLVEISKFFSTF